MGTRNISHGESGTPSELYGVVDEGKPLSRAIWTADMELAEDMYANSSEPSELWVARRIAGD